MKHEKQLNEEQGQQSHITKAVSGICLFIGSLGLLVSVFTDAVAVFGRHIGIALIGSIEIVQTAIVLFASSAMVLTTIHAHHASVKALMDRLNGRVKKVVAVINAFICSCYCMLLFIGCAWVINQTWNEHERSELLHIPYTELRIILAGTLLVMAALFVYQSMAVKK